MSKSNKEWCIIIVAAIVISGVFWYLSTLGPWVTK